MVKRMYVVASLLSIAAPVYGMGNKSASDVFNAALNTIVPPTQITSTISSAVTTTITSLENEMGQIVPQHSTVEIALLAAAVCAAWKGAEYVYGYFNRPSRNLILDDPSLQNQHKELNGAQTKLLKTGQFVEEQHIKNIVYEQFKDVVDKNNFATKSDVNTATDNMRKEVVALNVILNGDPNAKGKDKPSIQGVVPGLKLLTDRVATLEVNATGHDTRLKVLEGQNVQDEGSSSSTKPHHGYGFSIFRKHQDANSNNAATSSHSSNNATTTAQNKGASNNTSTPNKAGSIDL